MSATAKLPTPVNIFLRVLGLVGGLVGLYFTLGGAYLVILGGSWFYVISGPLLLLAAYYLFQGDMRGVWLYLIIFAITIVWAFFEVGFRFWPLVPRIISHLVIAIAVLLAVPLISPQRGRPANAMPFVYAAAALAVVFAVYFWQMFYPHDIIAAPQPVHKGKVSEVTSKVGNDWPSYGRTGEGTRYVPTDQINRDNVAKLERAWVVHHGDIAKGSDGTEDQNTPLYANGLLYHCSAHSRVTAIKPSTGKVVWQFDPKSSSPYWKRCRTLGYYDPAQNPGTPTDDCGPRILLTTIDTRLIALKASTGEVCQSFGNKGTVDLSVGMGKIEPGFYVQTTGPFVARDKIILSGWVADNVSLGEPSGVIRAFNAVTGELDWAWDLGDPSITKLPPEGKTYTLGTPNVWAPMAFDEQLGMVYLPLGNATPDYYGGQRRPFDDEYNAAIVALDLMTGREKWHFRTVNHDLWDFDIPAQPMLFDFPDGKGGTAPGLIQLTKRGQIFVLDRRTGKPLTKVEERPVPKGDGTAIGEYYAPTQPYSVEMPAPGDAPLTEARMWGATPIDHLMCRIKFRRHRYEGDFTTQSLKPSIIYPGNNGGPNWGTGSIDQERNILVVGDMRMPVTTRLIERKDLPPPDKFKPDPHAELSPQFGLPFGHHITNFFSPIGIPCLEPPMGTVSGIDLYSRKLIWQQPAGTMQDVSLGKFQPGLAMYVGMPALGGVVSTRGGLSFHSGTQDYYLRAYDTETGKVLWAGRLPTGGQSTPMTFVDKESGRQFVVVAAGGARYNPNDRDDAIVAFALPVK